MKRKRSDRMLMISRITLEREKETRMNYYERCAKINFQCQSFFFHVKLTTQKHDEDKGTGRIHAGI
jgi:hypothetical protein